jgi:hypothetical protein
VRNLSQKFRGSLAQNNRRKEDSHPDFLAKLTIWNTTCSAAAWLSKTSKGDLYVALRLSSEGQSQSEKIKLAIWRNHERSSVSDPHFESVQEIFGRYFVLQAWILAAGDNYTLEITIVAIEHSTRGFRCGPGYQGSTCCLPSPNKRRSAAAGEGSSFKDFGQLK